MEPFPLHIPRLEFLRERGECRRRFASLFSLGAVLVAKDREG